MKTQIPLFRSGWLHVAAWAAAVAVIGVGTRGLPTGSPDRQMATVLFLLAILGLCVTALSASVTWLRGRAAQ